MTDFLIKSTLAMGVLLGIYYILFEREKMHRFNRFYLISALVFSLALPLIYINVYYEVETVKQAVSPQPLLIEASEILPVQNIPSATIEEHSIDYTPYLLWGIYALITCSLAIRFINNLAQLKRKIKSNTILPYDNAYIVLTEDIIQPYTFLNYIFLNREGYENQTIENEVLAHEIAHVKQKHTLDILFIEVLKTVLWFNPVLYFYKKSIQLNHEFLADENVIAQNNNIKGYQQLLLKRLNPGVSHQIASCLNFKLTKKRLLMMTKSTSKTRSAVVKLLMLPIISVLIYLIAVKSIAQEKQHPDQIQQNHSVAKINEETEDDKARDRYYAGVRVILKNCRREVLINKPYEELTLDQKRDYLFIIPKPAVKKSPTEKQFNGYKNKSKYAVWIDGQNVDNSILNNYKASDFAAVFGSSVFKNARTEKHPQPFQLSLYTHSYFNKKLKNRHLKHSSDTTELILRAETRTKEQFEAGVTQEND